MSRASAVLGVLATALASNVMALSLDPIPTHKLRQATDSVCQAIVNQFKIPGTDLYRDIVRNGQPEQQPAFLWPLGVLLSAYAQGVRVDEHKYRPLLTEAYKGLDLYWTTASPGGYAVLPGQHDNPDRYYDDNAWVVWDALDAYLATRQPQYLEVAKGAYTFMKSGEDEKLGGGIYWREREKTSKNACSNAPGAAVALLLYSATKGSVYLEDANRWIKWTETLIGTNGFVQDHITLDGKVEPQAWSYNTAVLIQAYVFRYQILHDKADLGKAEVMLRKAIQRWIEPNTGLSPDPGMFAFHLIDAMVLVSKETHNPTYRDKAAQTAWAVYTHCRDEHGLFGEHWNRKPTPGEGLTLHFQASVLKALLAVS